MLSLNKKTRDLMTTPKACRTKIILVDKRLPIVPGDKCWSQDGHVYVEYSAMVEPVTRMVGQLQDTTMTGTWDLTVITPSYDEVTVDGVYRGGADAIPSVIV